MARRAGLAIPDEIIMNKIYYIRGHKIMLDKDLAALYGVETKRLKEQVKRNMDRFPAHFMFELTKEEDEFLRSQNATLELKQGGYSKYLPYAFTEHGILMLSNVLKSPQAIKVSIKIIDIFVKIRQMLTDNTELRLAIEEIGRATNLNSENIKQIFRYLDGLNAKESKPSTRKMIGFKIPKKKIKIKGRKLRP